MMRARGLVLVAAMAVAVVTGAACEGAVPPAESAAQATAPAPGPNGLGDLAVVVSALDQALVAEQARLAVEPAPEADDATFVRRVTLDLTGVVPSATAVRAFLADAAPDKRDALVRSLLASPAYARHFADYWDGVLLGPIARAPRIDRVAFRRWLYARLAAGDGWDRVVTGLVTASGKSSTGGRRDLDGFDLSLPSEVAEPEGVNGAVNFMLRFAQAPQDLAGTVSRVFLGVQIQCAQCHDHPSEAWKQSDFRSFVAPFMQTRATRVGGQAGMGPPLWEVEDAERQTPRMRRRAAKTGFTADAPRALDGTDLAGEHPREALARWMVRPDNPYFARALVNRMWGTLLGEGFVEPIDDFRHDSGAVAPQALALLAEDFAGHGYDLRRLLRVICASSAYQRAPSGGSDQRAAWSRFALRPMDSAALLDSLVTAADLGPAMAEVLGERFAEVKLKLRRDFAFAFDVDGDGGASDDFSGSVPQALMLLNGVIATASSSALGKSTLGRVLSEPGDGEAQIDELFLAALSRVPSADERAHYLAYVREVAAAAPVASPKSAPGPITRLRRQLGRAADGARAQAYEDVFWALINSSEFFFNH